MSRVRAYVFGWSVVAAVVYPVTFPQGRDSYPLSSYPMFSSRRAQPTVYFAQAVDPRGEGQRVPPELIGSSEVMQAAVTVRRAVQGGKKRMRELCGTIAANAVTDPRLQGAERIQLMSAQVDPIEYFVEGSSARKLTKHHSCPVRGRK